MSEKSLFEVRNIKIVYPLRGHTGDSFFTAVDDVSFSINRGEILGLVGESGCGKSSLLSSALMLRPPDQGEIWFGGIELTSLSPYDLQKSRNGMQIIFQNPVSSLNPRMNVLELLTEPLDLKIRGKKREKAAKAAYMLELVGLNQRDLYKKPGEFSGGERQRIAIARSLITNPELLFADEPVSALDVSVQAQILNLIKDLKDELDFSVLFVSHDFRVIRNICDRVMVMKKGKIIEKLSAEKLFTTPDHSYTKELLSAAGG